MIVIFFVLLLVGATVTRIRYNQKKAREAHNAFLQSEGVQALIKQGFETKDNLVFTTREGFVVGVYYRVSNKPEYFTFINCVVPKSVSNMMTFNRKYKDERMAIDSRSGFCQELSEPLTEQNLNMSFARLITIAQTENFEPLKPES